MHIEFVPPLCRNSIVWTNSSISKYGRRCHFLLGHLLGLHHGGVIVFQVVEMLIDIQSTTKIYHIIFIIRSGCVRSLGRECAARAYASAARSQPRPNPSKASTAAPPLLVSATIDVHGRHLQAPLYPSPNFTPSPGLWVCRASKCISNPTPTWAEWN
jgi:hypothetical protein